MTEIRRVLDHLERHGLLLKQDRTLPNVVALVTGETLRGSWWSHPKARLIFRVLEEAAGRPDVVVAKLLGGKDTLVHRRLWPALHGAGRAGEAWQTGGLTAQARRLLARVRRDGTVRAPGDPAREIARRLLAHAWQEHTEAGRHEIFLEAWDHWARRARAAAPLPPEEARAALEEAASRLGAPLRLLPWR